MTSEKNNIHADHDRDGAPQTETSSVLRSELTHPEDSTNVDAIDSAEDIPEGTALLIVKRGPNSGSRFLLERSTTSAGRHPDSDIFLDDVTVSRRHAEFRNTNGVYEVVDVGSLNGTYVNREPVDSSPLANGDEVQIGKFRLVFSCRPKE